MPSYSGPIWLDDNPHRLAFGILRDELDLNNTIIASAIEWAAPSLSNATKVDSRNPRSIPADKFSALIEYLKEVLESSTRASEPFLRYQLDQLLTASGASPSRDAPPGAIQHMGSSTAIRPNWLSTGQEHFRDIEKHSASQRIWLLGGPMTGKTSAVAALTNHAKSMNYNIIGFDIQDIHEKPGAWLAHPKIDIVLERVLFHVLGSESPLSGHELLGVEYLAECFVTTLERSIRLRFRGSPTIIYFDHFYLLGTQGSYTAPENRQLFDDFNHKLMVQLSKLHIPNASIIIVDDLTSTSSKDVSKHWTKGEPVICLVNTRDVVSLWRDIAKIELSEDEANHLIEILGRSIFIHHAAANICLSDVANSDHLQASY